MTVGDTFLVDNALGEMSLLLMEKIFFFYLRWVRKNNRLQRQKVTIKTFLSHEKLIGFSNY